MLLLLLGADEGTLSLLNSLNLGVDTPLQVLGWLESATVADALSERYPNGLAIDTYEEFAQAVRDGVVVIAGPHGDLDAKESLLRDLARDSVPLILGQPCCSGIFAVELDMIQRDTRAPMVPYHPESQHPIFGRLAAWVSGDDAPIGAVEQLTFERFQADRSDPAVRHQLAQDAMLLRRMLGKFHRVGAMPAKEVSSLSNLSVQLTGESQAVARWSVGPVVEQSGAKVTLVGGQGRIELQLPDDGDWKLSSTVVEVADETLPALDQRQLADHIRAALAGECHAPTWEDAFRALDLADLACESVRRGKTLPVSNERLTDEDTFKSMMAAGGCLILSVLPFLLLLVSVIDGLEIPRQRLARLSLVAAEREVLLPGDFRAVEFVRHVGDSADLTPMSEKQLFETYGRNTQGKPLAYHLGRNSITVAPAADGSYELEIGYEGHFRIWRGWPILLLAPIVGFLLLQLLKLAFKTSDDAPA